jgi:hypothetical protein
MAIHRKRFRVEEAIVGEMPSPEMIEEAAPMHSEIMAELRAIRAQMAKGAAPLTGSAAMAAIDASTAQELSDARTMLDTYRAQIEQCEKLKVELDLIHDAIDRTKREIATLHGKSFDGGEMAKVNGELGAVVGGTEQATQQILEAAESIDQAASALGKVDSVDWIRLHYTFPSAFDDELIDAIASEPKVVKYVDVPLQHISDPMLKRMRRGHSSRVTRELVKTLKARIDGLVLRTTFIVGHPGETDAEFDELCEFVAESKFDRAGAFTYSIEPGTVSAMLPNRVDPDVAAERQQKLMEIQRQISRARHDAMVGQQLDVLVEGVSSESEYLLEGRWYGQAPGIDGVTFLADGEAKTGSIVRARVTQGSDYDLAATLEL